MRLLGSVAWRWLQRCVVDNLAAAALVSCNAACSSRPVTHGKQQLAWLLVDKAMRSKSAVITAWAAQSSESNVATTLHSVTAGALASEG